MVTVTTSNPIARDFIALVLVPKAGPRLVRCNPVQGNPGYLEENLATATQTRRDQIFQDFMLTVDRYRFATGQFREIDAVELTAKS